MATKLILTLTLCLLVVGCFFEGGCSQQQKCDIQRLIASEPSRSVKSEGGVVDIWEHNTSEFRCTGFIVLRSTTHPGGLLVPSYTIAPYLTLIEQGSGVQSMIMQGCPETFQSEDELDAEYSIGRNSRPRRRERRLSGERDQHQKVFRIRKGDVMASPSGAVQWTYNDGDTDLIRVSLIDSYSIHNQLDENVRSFFLSGRRQSVGSDSEQHKSKSNQAWTGGVFSGLDDGILSEIFIGTKPETIRKLKGVNDKRGSIVHAGVLNITVLEDEEEEANINNVYGGGDDCSLKFKHNIDSPGQADVFNQGAGRINTVNSKSLPILKRLGLSAQHVLLYKNAIIGPRWNQNAHSALYVIKGGGRAQVVGDEGNTVFDDVLHKGQILVIPQGFVLVVKAGPDGVEWVEVKTSHNPITSPIVGGTSLLRAIPVGVLASAFDISTEEAIKIKNTKRDQVELFTPFDS